MHATTHPHYASLAHTQDHFCPHLALRPAIPLWLSLTIMAVSITVLTLFLYVFSLELSAGWRLTPKLQKAEQTSTVLERPVIGKGTAPFLLTDPAKGGTGI